MKFKRFTTITLALALTAGTAFTSFAAGFVSTSQGKKYQWGDGSYCTNNWVHYKDHWFYFGSDQLMRTGWIQRDNTWYYAASTGELQGGIMKINGNAYYFDTSTCKMVTGPYSYSGDTYNFTENGATPDSPYIYTEWDSYGHVTRGYYQGPFR